MIVPPKTVNIGRTPFLHTAIFGADSKPVREHARKFRVG